VRKTMSTMQSPVRIDTRTGRPTGSWRASGFRRLHDVERNGRGRSPRDTSSIHRRTRRAEPPRRPETAEPLVQRQGLHVGPHDQGTGRFRRWRAYTSRC